MLHCKHDFEQAGLQGIEPCHLVLEANAAPCGQTYYIDFGFEPLFLIQRQACYTITLDQASNDIILIRLTSPILLFLVRV